jgi:RNA polymerase sigma-70 factor, ECF subfamily
MSLPDEVKKWYEIEVLEEVPDKLVPQEVQDWFQSIVVRNYRLFFSIAYGVLGTSQDAEDAVQEGVLKAYRNLRLLEEPEKIVGWIARITRNMALDVVKKGGAARSYFVTANDAEVDSTHVTSGNDESIETRILLLQEIEKLPEGQAQVLLLKYLEDLDINEIAERLGIRPNAAQVRLYRAYQALSQSQALRAVMGIEL